LPGFPCSSLSGTLVSYGASAVTRTSDRGHLAEGKPMSIEPLMILVQDPRGSCERLRASPESRNTLETQDTGWFGGCPPGPCAGQNRKWTVCRACSGLGREAETGWLHRSGESVWLRTCIIPHGAPTVPRQSTTRSYHTTHAAHAHVYVQMQLCTTACCAVFPPAPALSLLLALDFFVCSMCLRVEL
jgi:hypothetical protein